MRTSLFVTLTLATVGWTASLDSTQWSYAGATGPAHWASLSPNNKACDTGRHQSPINLLSSTAKLYTSNSTGAGVPTLSFNWRPTGSLTATHNGHALQVDLSAEQQQQNTLTYNSTTYNMQQFHVHTPSEHRIDGRHYDGEVHFVSKSSDGKLLVVGVFLETATCHKNNLLANIAPHFTMDLSSVPALTKDFWNYNGSLTTPPCTEGVTWIVLNKPLKVNGHQMQRLMDTTHFNARFTMPTY
ncbi:alpha carbonic anhydrase [Syncephalis plumigaleata]|nr:alpha carbonic anhydrase [Syncephalis plumigaleata]